MRNVSNKEMREYLDTLLRIDDKSAQLRRGLVSSAIEAYIGTEITDNDINRLYPQAERLEN